MLVVREVFTAMPGKAGKFAKLMKRFMPEARVLTDVVGPYNTVICEWEVESLAEFEKKMAEYHAGDMDPKMKEEMAHYHEMYQTGRREIFREVE